MSDGCLEGVWPHSPQRLLRDMLWLLATPDLVTLAEHLAGRPTPAELGLVSAAQRHAWLAHHADHFRQDESSAVPRQTAARPTRRLPPQRMGHYHERLWHLLLDSAPNTRLLGHNVRITQRRLTLGELDILYRTRQNPAPMHLEVAIKFYLGLPEGPGEQTSQSRWVGLGGLDSLALKCQHLRQHQLPLSCTPPARHLLRHWLAPRDSGEILPALQPRVAMPGVLFYPWHATLPPPDGATPDHRRGLWCYRKDWPALAESYADAPSMAWLEKPHWLAPPLPEPFDALALKTASVMTLIDHYGPQQVMLSHPAHPPLRVMIVPDGWPQQIPLPPYTTTRLSR